MYQVEISLKPDQTTACQQGLTLAASWVVNLYMYQKLTEPYFLLRWVKVFKNRYEETGLTNFFFPSVNLMLCEGSMQLHEVKTKGKTQRFGFLCPAWVV